MAFIRPYRASDKDACAHIQGDGKVFSADVATLPPSLAASPGAFRLAPYCWTHQFTLLSPETCHVLDDGSGTAVGYCIGCPDVHAMLEAYPRFIDEVLLKEITLRPPSLEPQEPWTIVPGEDYVADFPIVNPAALLQLAFRPDLLLLHQHPAPASNGVNSSDTSSGEAQLSSSQISRYRATMHIDLLPAWQAKGWGGKLIERFVESVRDSGADYGAGERIGVAAENRKVLPFYAKMGFQVALDGSSDTIVLVKDINSQ